MTAYSISLIVIHVRIRLLWAFEALKSAGIFPSSLALLDSMKTTLFSPGVPTRYCIDDKVTELLTETSQGSIKIYGSINVVGLSSSNGKNSEGKYADPEVLAVDEKK